MAAFAILLSRNHSQTGIQARAKAKNGAIRLAVAGITSRDIAASSRVLSARLQFGYPELRPQGTDSERKARFQISAQPLKLSALTV